MSSSESKRGRWYWFTYHAQQRAVERRIPLTDAALVVEHADIITPAGPDRLRLQISSRQARSLLARGIAPKAAGRLTRPAIIMARTGAVITVFAG